MLYNHDDEKYLIGGLLLDPELQKRLPELPEELMHDDGHRAILCAMRDLQREKKPVEVLSVQNRLSELKLLETAGGIPYLMQCVQFCPTTANIGHYIEELRELSASRRAFLAAKQFQEALAFGEPVDSAAAALHAELSRCARQTGGVTTMAHMMGVVFDHVERASKGEITGLRVGLPEFDGFTGGLLGGDLIVIGARPGVGKSALAMEMAVNVAQRGKRALVCSREMNELQYGLRVASRLTGVDQMALKTGKLNPEEFGRLADGINEGAALDIGFLFDHASVESLRAECLKQQKPIDLLVVDYLQLMGTESKTQKRYEEVGAVSRGLKLLAKEIGAPVIALSQVARAQTKQTEVCPTMSELRESGNIEQDADLIAMLHHPTSGSDESIPSYDKETREAIEGMENSQYVVVKLEKQRMGPKGSFGMQFDASHMRYYCIERGKK